jgi:hypothetical protein
MLDTLNSLLPPLIRSKFRSLSTWLAMVNCLLLNTSLLLTGRLDGETVLESRPMAQATQIDELPAWKTIFSDPIWQKPNVKAFALQAPSNVVFKNPPEKTQVRTLWSKDCLLIRFDCNDQSIVYLPGSDATAAPRDLPYFKADAVEVFLDPVGDGRMYMEVELSPNNGVFDAIYFCTAPPRSKPDLSLENQFADRDLFSLPEWNLAGLKTTTRIWPNSEGTGWSAIAAFPASEILHRLGRKQFAPGMQMKINFVRFNYSSDVHHPLEITNWSPVLAGCAHVSPAGMGTISLGNP